MDDVVELIDAADGHRVEEKAGDEEAGRAGRFVLVIKRLGAFEQGSFRRRWGLCRRPFLRARGT